ncbi:MAG: SPFH domain-containing protein [Acidobacteriota bacterium]
MDPAQMTGIALGLGGLGALLTFIFIKTNIVICQPNEIVIISGRKRKAEDGTVYGYRILRGGRGFKWPFIESVARLSLNTEPLALHLPKVLTDGMIPIAIEARANIKLAGSTEAGMDNAIERFLGKDKGAMVGSAKQTLEGALRGLVADYKPEEANRKRLELANAVSERARGDLRNLGIVLDFFQIHEITDENGYLEAIGRKRNAAVRRDATIAEAEAEAEARKVAAEQKRLGREAEIASELEVIVKENALSVRQSELAAESNRAEQRARVATDIARVEQQVELESKRTELAERREQADTVIPARAQLEASRMLAAGDAASILEEGKAQAAALQELRQEWENGEARDLFLIRLLPELLDKVTSVVSDNLRLDKLTVLDGGQGEGLSNYVNNLTGSAVVMLEQLKNATGVDLAELASSGGKDGPNSQVPKELG